MLKRMLKHLGSQENRREWYTIASLVLGAFTFTHWLWGWPLGSPAPAPVPDPAQVTAIPPAEPTSLLALIPWRHLLEGLPLLAVGILYYLGRRHGKTPATALNADASIKVLQQQVDHWRAKWEEERGGSSARDQIIEQLKTQSSASSSTLFHPGILNLGMRIESAVYGSAKKPPLPVTDKIAFAAATGIAEIPVNHYELCGGQDPDPGEDKFLTVAISTTIRQGDKFKLPMVWPTTLPALAAPPSAPPSGSLPKIQQPTSNNKELAKEDVHLIVKPHLVGIISYLFNDTLDVLTGCCLTMTKFQEFSPRHKDFRRDHFSPRTLIRMGPIRSNKPSDAFYLASFQNADKMILLIAAEATGTGISRIELNTEGVWRLEFLVEAQGKTRKEEYFLSWKPGEDPVIVDDPRGST